jgi:glycosyltransferase involved in cell wall biosynthesis
VNASKAHAPSKREDPQRTRTLLIVATVAHTIGNFLLPYAAHFRSLGWRVDAAANSALADRTLLQAFDHVYELPLSRSILDVGRIVRAERAVTRLLQIRPDIVHVHTPIAGFVTRVAVRREPAERRPAVVYTAHGFHFYDGGNPITNAVFLTAERAAGRWTDRLVVINQEDETAARDHRIIPPDRLVRMPGIGVDTRRYSRSSITSVSSVELEGLGVPTDAPLFVVVAELSPRKRVHDAIAALASMRRKDAHLLVAGQGPERVRLERLAVITGVRERVHFLGHVADVRPLVSASIALMLPSEREGLARSVMEALSLEVPVIASTARGNRELIGTDSGILVATADSLGLAAAMDRLAENPDERRAMGARGRERMVENYDLPILLRMHESLYEAVLAERTS